ncbi:hypothetical protein, partial [Tenacibaculum maritimum]|uniref:hypothetical protein n=2 Tax=Tenacibaculum maritimum TaxID=107401 RepID=UPI003876A81C
QNNKKVFAFKAVVGEFSQKSNALNAADFKDHAIAKITLQSTDQQENKQYKDALNKAEGKTSPFYIAMDAEPANQNWFEVKYEEVFDNRPNLWYYGEGNWFELKVKIDNSQYYICKTGNIKLIKGKNLKNDYLIETNSGNFKLIYTLEENSYGLVKFPASGNGFNRYGTIDKGDKNHGAGDHYLLPKTAASIFGVINEIHNKGWEIHLGDMSSEDGKDPWQPGSKHHSGHGGKRGRKGLDIDFRYLNKKGVSFHGNNDQSDFSKEKNKIFFEIAYKYGFRKNYCTNMKTVLGENIKGTKDISYHKDHGHIGLSNQQIETIKSI